MRTWSLPPEAPLSLCLAADARLTPPSYVDDQIWELSLAGGDPAAVAVHTSYGLRARSMRIFPSFTWRGQPRLDPADYAGAPRVELLLPNYSRLRMSPFHDLDVLAEYWVANSQSLLGRFTLLNQGEEGGGEMQLRLHAVLQPAEGGSPMIERHLQGASVLAGSSGELQPLLFLGGGAVAETTAQPALSVRQHLGRGEPLRLFWAHIGAEEVEAALTEARSFAASNWEAQIARLERSNGTWVDIDSGDPSRDAVFAASQQVALRLQMGSSRLLPHDSFVLNRGPDDGYSARGDGRDHETDWSGQEALAAFYLGRQLLPLAPDRVRAWLRNFIYVQGGRGEIDSRPGLAGQRSGDLAQPLLATLTWEYFRATEDDEFLREAFPALFEFFSAWFSKRHDRDGDGVPEWDHIVHSGNSELPTFVGWSDWGQGLDIRCSETPGLVAYLLRECRSLIAIAQQIGRSQAVAEVEARATALRQSLDRSWDEGAGTFRHLDRDLHVASEGRRLGAGQGECTITIDEVYDPMVRLVIRIGGPETQASDLAVTVHGRGPKGQFRTERLERDSFHWFWEHGTATTENTFARLDRVEIKSVSDEFRTEVNSADFTRRDLSLLLPLWSGAIDDDRTERLIESSLLQPEQYWRDRGLPACAADDTAYAPAERSQACGVDMLWNSLLAEGLLAAGRRTEAAELVQKMLASCRATLERDRGFRTVYHPDVPGGFGRRDSAYGLFPLRLFLDVLGVRLVSPWKLEIEGSNPYPWPVQVRWRGLQVERPVQGSTVVQFPDGHEVEVDGTERQVIERIR